MKILLVLLLVILLTTLVIKARRLPFPKVRKIHDLRYANSLNGMKPFIPTHLSPRWPLVRKFIHQRRLLKKRHLIKGLSAYILKIKDVDVQKPLMSYSMKIEHINKNSTVTGT